MKIGVTGGIGSGKSLLCGYFEQQGFPVIRADNLAKELMVADPSVRGAVTQAFGPDSYTPEGNLNRAYLAAVVFSRPGNVRLMNRIVHPAVIAANHKLTLELLASHPIVFHEAALIFEAKMKHCFDLTVAVWAPESVAFSRAAARDGVSFAEIKARAVNQLPLHKKIGQADIAVANAGSPEELFEKAALLLRILKGMAGAA